MTPVGRPDLDTTPHRRYDPLTGRWVVVSPGRTRRPWQGAQEGPPPPERPAYDPDCYLCPGNSRAGGARNPDYGSTFAFTNDFAALRPDVEHEVVAPHRLLHAETEPGTCRVLCFSPRHDLTLADMGHDEVRAVVELWIDQVDELSATYRWVQVFENKGETMGASNPHPHGQVWACETVPTEPAVEDERQHRHLERHGSRLLTDYVELELHRDERVVAANDGWVALVPFWAVWPFETLVLPRRPRPRLTDLDDGERDRLVEVLRELLHRYDALFDHPFPYSMGWHGAPARPDADHWQVHAHFYPPLLRSPTVRKWMVGYEMLADGQRDLGPEEAAQRLRSLPAREEPPSAP